ncbi:MAG: beta-lactamase family protein [Candidatus Tectomicrobia bacterium]|nr:beta-lactamase family protein [Candidatus Tectomicrobia bacterium]
MAIMTEIKIHGECERKFAAVKDAFVANFASGEEIGAAVAVTVDGQTVVDLWAGFADQARTRPWERNTIATVYSTTKGMTAICAHRLVEQGFLDLDAPVAKYWPEFAQAGKQDVPVHMLLSHQVGLPAVSKKLPPGAIYEWDTMTKVLAEQRPFWEPGTRHGYHALTYGWLVGEAVRRISGKSLGRFFRDEVAGPLELDFHIGIGAEHDHRVAEMIAVDPASEAAQAQAKLREEKLQSMDPALREAQGNIQLLPDSHNSEQWRRSEIPAANGHSDARSLARVYGALARGGEMDGVHVLSRETIGCATVEQAKGTDAILTFPTRFALGFMLSHSGAPMGPNPNNFGHPGAGGSVGFADPDAHIGFGYVMNQMKIGVLVEGTGRRLIDALYASL